MTHSLSTREVRKVGKVGNFKLLILCGVPNLPNLPNIFIPPAHTRTRTRARVRTPAHTHNFYVRKVRKVRKSAVNQLLTAPNLLPNLGKVRKAVP